MVIDAVERELAGDGSVDAERARVLAARLDDPATAASAVAGMSKELGEVMARWRESHATRKGQLDELLERRKRRKAG